MKKAGSYSIDQLRDYSSLFSRGSALHWINGEFETIDFKIHRYDQEWVKHTQADYLSYLKRIYKILQHEYQNEYVYKNELLTKWLIDELGETNSKVYSEFRVANSVADLVMFNGHSKVFEIKTDLDTNLRLEMQLNDYRSAFNYLYIVIPESRFDEYSDLPNEVGIILFTNKIRSRFKVARKAIVNNNINTNAIMEILHSKEYLNIVQKYYGYLPDDLTSFNQFRICGKLISEIPYKSLNKLFITTLKERRKNNAISKHYQEFNQLSLALDLSKKDKQVMIQQLKTPINI